MRVYPAVHRGDELDVALSDLQKMDGVSVGTLKKEKKSGFSHLKLYGFDSEAGLWLFATSANCTLAALGGNNVEAGLLRRVQRDILDEYFTEEPSVRLPDGVRKSDFVEGDGWLPFWAVDRGNAIELLVSESAMVPLSNATITIRVGGVTESCNLQMLFENGKSERINWSHFQEVKDKANKSILILLEATNSTGKQVRGASLVDNPLLLTSDPKHRSAWRAAMSLLENEGLPESADLASIYHLVQDVFDADDNTSREKEREIHPAKSHSREVTPDKLPIWPPIASQEWFGSSSVGGRLHDLQWFQKILAELLNPKRESTEVLTSAKTADSMDDEVAKETREVQIPERAVNAVWKRASHHYQLLQTRLSKLEVTIGTAKKIWPIAVAVLLVTLLTRRQLAQHRDRGVERPSAAELIRDFLQMLFFERMQPSNYSPSASSRYMYETFPSIASDLHESFEQNPPKDIACIICLMFACSYVAETRLGRRISSHAWLQFRTIAPAVAAGEELERETLRTVFERYVIDESEGMAWSDIEGALDELTRTGWSSHEGYRELATIMRCGIDHTHGDKLPNDLRERWTQTERRIRLGQRWHFAVDPLSDTCAADDCGGQYISDPTKSRDLRRLAPTICSACGAVLIPNWLWRAYEKDHEHHSQ